MSEINNDIRTYDLKQLTEILQLSRRTLYRYINDGKLPAVKIGSEWRISEEALKKLINP